MDQPMRIHSTVLHGLEAITIENRFLRLVVLPQAGAKIWQITYKPLDVDLLWNNGNIGPARNPLHANYDDAWSGGWDELFPNDETGKFEEDTLPDHGELWTGEWQSQSFQKEDSVVVHLSFSTPVSKFRVEKILTVWRDKPCFEIRYRLTNEGLRAFPFLFKLHPAFAVCRGDRIEFPPMTVQREPDFPGTLGEAPSKFPWPYAHLKESVVDLRQVPDPSARAVHFFYGTDLASGWCGMIKSARQLAAALRFDSRVFSSCWLFATYGGWRDLNVAVLEPATGYPVQFQSMIENGQARHLSPGESLETEVLFSVQEGLASISRVEKDGRIIA